ncbi:MAG TPA: DUF5985 family protein [Candidatus Polarisedimenticolia bacterium]|nr:DUF5985 family protein [Candidatus Polarisedimenticolia bacterium]
MISSVLHGALVSASAIAGLFFLRFWRTTADRLFLAFALAFWMMSLQWLVAGLMGVQDESRHFLFLLRLAAFVLILVAVWDKNRTR